MFIPDSRVDETTPRSKDFKDVNIDPNLDHGKWVKNCTKNSGGTNRQTYGGESYWHMSV